MQLTKAGRSERLFSAPPDTEGVNRATVALIREELTTTRDPWFVGFSGGKDSSAVLKLVYQALAQLRRPERRKITVVYCDTGVEIPVVRALVRTTLRRLKRESLQDELPIDVKIAIPRLTDRYLVKVIGRGYPPPSNKFRWCTDRLRIKPVQRVLRAVPGGKSTVLLGLRRGESSERDRILQQYETAGGGRFRQSGNVNTTILAPIIDYTVEEVWSTLTWSCKPYSIDTKQLTTLYKAGSGECPLVREPNGSACAQGRFGCWTCTVVRKDRAVTSMVKEGYTELTPLLEWRNWIQSIRDEPRYRCARRRNGAIGPGPFTLRARRMLLDRLLDAQEASGLRLISGRERAMIESLWTADRKSKRYWER